MAQAFLPVFFTLRVAQQRLEAEIHVLLDMAVKQRRPRLVGGKVAGRR
ncbi:hypothetical protein SBA4_5140004 [Candidatus Sulfopaludibacter sp. SbA4]|nr:hypothetical protein SBA4_5140004 [Candidatus Sulfopaludibacter sp. SbA4]